MLSFYKRYLVCAVSAQKRAVTKTPILPLPWREGDSESGLPFLTICIARLLQFLLVLRHSHSGVSVYPDFNVVFPHVAAELLNQALHVLQIMFQTPLDQGL